MPLFDLSADFQVFDNTEAVTFLSRNSADQFAEFSLTSALRQPTMRDDIGSDRVLSREKVMWMLYANDLQGAGAPEPKVSDRITDSAGVSWDVMDVLKEVWLTQYTLTCQKAM